MSKIEIIENTKEARDKFGRWWGCENVILTREHIKALLDGKCIAWNDGEYTHFLSLELPEGEI